MSDDQKQMDDDRKRFDLEMYWSEKLIHTPVRIVAFCACALLVGHLSFGLPDFGITSTTIFAIWAVSVLLLWLTTNISGRRLDKSIEHNVRESGFSDAEIETLKNETRWWKI